MSTKAFIYDQHEKHQDWLSRLAFYKEEINIFRERLGEIIRRNTDEEVKKNIEVFENKLIVQRNNIDELRHSIRVHEQKIIAEIEQNPIAVDHSKMEAHEEEEDFMGYFEKNFAELREAINRFAAKWM